MTPKEKCDELVDKYNFLKEIFIPSIHEQKQCALIAVDEIVSGRPGYPYSHELGIEVNGILNQINYPYKYWKEVKTEINKL